MNLLTQPQNVNDTGTSAAKVGTGSNRHDWNAQHDRNAQHNWKEVTHDDRAKRSPTVSNRTAHPLQVVR